MMIVVYFVSPILFYMLFRYIANAVRLGNTRKEMIQISTSLVAKIVGSMPLFFYLMLGLISKAFDIPKARGYICDLLPNAYLEHDVSVPGKFNLQSIWRNCSYWDNVTSGYMYDENLDPSSYTLKDEMIDGAIVEETALNAATTSQTFQALEVTLLFLTSIILIRVRKKSIKDIFNLKITISEVSLNLFLDPNTTAIEHVLTFTFFFFVLLLIDVHRYHFNRHLPYRHLFYRHCLTT